MVSAYASKRCSTNGLRRHFLRDHHGLERGGSIDHQRTAPGAVRAKGRATSSSRTSPAMGPRIGICPVCGIALGQHRASLHQRHSGVFQRDASGAVRDACRLIDRSVQHRVSWRDKHVDREARLMFRKFNLADHPVLEFLAGREHAQAHRQGHESAPRTRLGNQKWKRHAMEGMMGNKPYSRMMRVPSASVSAKAKKGFKLL